MGMRGVREEEEEDEEGEEKRKKKKRKNIRGECHASYRARVKRVVAQQPSRGGVPYLDNSWGPSLMASGNEARDSIDRERFEAHD